MWPCPPSDSVCRPVYNGGLCWRAQPASGISKMRKPASCKIQAPDERLLAALKAVPPTDIRSRPQASGRVLRRYHGRPAPAPLQCAHCAGNRGRCSSPGPLFTLINTSAASCRLLYDKTIFSERFTLERPRSINPLIHQSTLHHEDSFHSPRLPPLRSRPLRR